jgi:hypothetical protein
MDECEGNRNTIQDPIVGVTTSELAADDRPSVVWLCDGCEAIWGHVRGAICPTCGWYLGHAAPLIDGEATFLSALGTQRGCG